MSAPTEAQRSIRKSERESLEQAAVIEGWVPANALNGSHGHWSKVQADRQEAQDRTILACRQAGWKRLDGHARLWVTLVFPVKRRRDLDGLYARIKGVVDGAKRWFVDDDLDHLDLIVKCRVEPGRTATELHLSAYIEGTA